MIRERPASTRSTPPSRRFSNNNPFRSATVELLQLDPQGNDSELRAWVASNTVVQPNFLNVRTGSQNSCSGSIPENGQYIVPSSQHTGLSSYSMASPPPAGSNNPFLDDLEASSISSSDVPGGTQSASANSYKHHSAEHNKRKPNERKPHTGEGQSHSRRGLNERAGPYLSAQEEKEQLRRAYIEGKQANGGEEDLPPAYEEVTRSSRTSSGYTADKKGDPRYRTGSSSRKAEHGHGSVSSSSRPRQHSKSGADHKGPYGHVKDRSRHGTSGKERKGSSKVPLPKNVDTIDKMDVTGLFGGAFHHDGPFDACTPHRNQNKKVAPVLAFPKDGPNSSLSGPSKAPSARDQVFGLEDDDSYLYRSANSGMQSANSSNNTLDAIKPHQEVTQFDAKVKADLVHGPTTQGLGSTTFLDGAPAAPVAIEEAMHRQNTLGRKKSLSQRLGRSPPVAQQSAGLSGNSGNHAARRNGNLKLIKTHSGHLESDDSKADDDELYLGTNYDNDMRKPSSGNKFLRRVKSLKVNRRG